MKLESDTATMLPPLFQPLRLWTPRLQPTVKNRRTELPESRALSKGAPIRSFTMRGGFVSAADGERRMVIVGKLFRSREQ